MKLLKALIITGLLTMTAFGQVDTNQSKFWMMSYFVGQADGLHLAFSSDTTGLNWQIYDNDQVVLRPTVSGATETLMRDPMIVFDTTTQSFHLMWTVSWTGTIIGYANSKTLKAWGTQKPVPVGAAIPNAALCWAPEIIWDNVQQKWMIYWSTSIGGSDTKWFYYSMTSDFVTFDAAKVLFNPGLSVIDADIMKINNNKFLMVFKDERKSTGTTESKNIHFVYGTTLQGPWKGPGLRGAADTVMSAKVVNAGTEGPSIVKVGDEYHLYFDPFSTTLTYRMVKVKNLDTLASPWPSAGILKTSTGANFNYSHSSVIEIPRRYVTWMLFNKTLPPTLTAPVNNTSVGLSGSLSLAWSKVDSATKYYVQVSSSNTFSPSVISDSTTSLTFAVSGLTSHTWYYWRVAGYSPAGGLGTWSTVNYFKTSEVGILDHKVNYSPSTVTHGILEVFQASGTRIAQFDYNGSSRVAKSTLLSNAKSGLAKGCYTYRLRVDSKVIESGSFIKN